MSLDRLEQAARTAMEIEDRPSLIIVRSHIGYGSPHKQDTSAAHGSPLGEEEVRLTKEAYGWDPDKHFYVPDEALAHFRALLRAWARARIRVGRSASTPIARSSPRRPRSSS